MNKKFLIKLQHQDFRNRVMSSISDFKMSKYKIPQYARYVVDSCIINRSKEHAEDKEYGYGFSPLQFLCAVKKDGVDKKLFEFNSVNHFLRAQKGDEAVEVVACILIKWTQEDSSIIDFDIDVIDEELYRIEQAYIQEQKRLEETDSLSAAADEQS